MLFLWFILAAAVVVGLTRLEMKMGKLDDRLDAEDAAIATLVGVVGEVVQEIADLKAQIGGGEPVTDEQLARFDAINQKLTDAAAALKAGE